MLVELVYFEGCPNVDRARGTLRNAFKAVGLSEKWTEWEQSNSIAPDYVRLHGSPTILIDGEDITGQQRSLEPSLSCRLYEDGAPAIDQLVKALKKSMPKP